MNLPGWYELSGGTALHLVNEGTFGRMRTGCGIRIRAAFGVRFHHHRTLCRSCKKLDWKASDAV